MRKCLQRLPTHDLAALIDKLYDSFDLAVTAHGAARIIDDSYMVVLEGKDTARKTAQSMLQRAKALVSASQQVSVTLDGDSQHPAVQIGIAAGQTYSALVGVKTTHFTYFGHA
eukprot:418923-Rhodomonas_salina.1